MPTLLMACVKGAHKVSPSQCNAPQDRVCCQGCTCSGTWKGSCLLSQGPQAVVGTHCFGTVEATQKGAGGGTHCQCCRQAACQGARAATQSMQGVLVHGVRRAGGEEEQPGQHGRSSTRRHLGCFCPKLMRLPPKADPKQSALSAYAQSCGLCLLHIV